MKAYAVRACRSTGSCRWAVLVAVAIASLVLYACGTTGTVDCTGTFDLPFIHVGWNSHSEHFDVTSNQAHTCVTLEWFDEKGNSLGAVSITTDGSGSAHGNVPPGAQSWELTVAPCPDRELVPPPFQGRERTTYFVSGSPLIPDDEIGAVNVTYAFQVDASSPDEVQSIVHDVLARGIGARVPSSLEVQYFATLTRTPDGARLVQAQPGRFTTWQLDFNQGAFTADLDHCDRFALGEWDVVTIEIPISAFDYGFIPGALHTNGGATSFQTDLLKRPVSTSYSCSYRD